MILIVCHNCVNNWSLNINAIKTLPMCSLSCDCHSSQQLGFSQYALAQRNLFFTALLPRIRGRFDLLEQQRVSNAKSINLPLNPSKCEAFFFSVDPHQANFQPNLLLLGSRLRFNPTPTFLWVTFDRTFSFFKHVSSLKAKFFPRLKALRCISAFSWGPSLFCTKLFFGPFSLTLHSDGFLS